MVNRGLNRRYWLLLLLMQWAAAADAQWAEPEGHNSPQAKIMSSYHLRQTRPGTFMPAGSSPIVQGSRYVAKCSAATHAWSALRCAGDWPRGMYIIT